MVWLKTLKGSLDVGGRVCAGCNRSASASLLADIKQFCYFGVGEGAGVEVDFYIGGSVRSYPYPFVSWPAKNSAIPERSSSGDASGPVVSTVTTI